MIYNQHKSTAHPQFQCNCLQRKKKTENIWCEHTRENSEAKKREVRQALKCIDQQAEHTCSSWNLAEHGKKNIFLTTLSICD